MAKKSRVMSREKDLERSEVSRYRNNLPLKRGLRDMMALVHAFPESRTKFYPRKKSVIVHTVVHQSEKIRQGRKSTQLGKPAPKKKQWILERFVRKELCKYQRERLRRAFFGFKGIGRRKKPRKNKGRFDKRC